MAADVEVVRTADVVSTKRRRKEIERLDAAVGAYRKSTVEIADAIYDCYVDEVWQDDEDFASARAAGRVDIANYNRDWFVAWADFRYGYRKAAAYYFVQAGEFRSIVSASTTVDALPVTENAYRSVTKALNPTYAVANGEVPDDDERNQVIRQLWTSAAREAERTGEGTPAETVRKFVELARDHEYKPIARRFAKGLNRREQKAQAAARVAQLERLVELMIQKRQRADVKAVFDRYFA